MKNSACSNLPVWSSAIPGIIHFLSHFSHIHKATQQTVSILYIEGQFVSLTNVADMHFETYISLVGLLVVARTRVGFLVLHRAPPRWQIGELFPDMGGTG